MFVFGDNWSMAGELAQILGLWMLFIFISSPISMLFIIKERQKEALLFNIVIFLSRVISIIVGYMVFSDIYYTLVVFTIVGVVIRVFLLRYLFQLVDISYQLVILELLKYFLPSIVILYVIRIV